MKCIMVLDPSTMGVSVNAEYFLLEDEQWELVRPIFGEPWADILADTAQLRAGMAPVTVVVAINDDINS